ncbi:MAG: type II secretion system F family protein [Phycisphaerae bacterium]|nr:type II secretion system F family protein [Phycisphaerae bacterium]
MIQAQLEQPPIDWTWGIITSAVIFVATATALWYGWQPIKALSSRQEARYDRTLRGRLLMDVKPRTMTVLSILVIVLLGLIGYTLTENVIGVVLFGAVGIMLPAGAMKVLARRRLGKLENQLVGGIQTLCSGVRAGLNLVQAMELVAKDGPVPLRQEFTHLLREYEYGVPLEEAMDNAAARIGSGDFRLLFAALQTHRERGGDLGGTLDRIADSIREIQRLENQVKTLTAQGRATARWLGAMPIIVLGILYFLVTPEGVKTLFVDDFGKLLLLIMIILNIAGFLWIRKIMAIDI